MSLSVFLVKGFKRGKHDKAASSFFSKSSTLGIGLGVAVLILALSVINGFELALQTRLLNVIPHVEYYAPNKPLSNFAKKEQQLKQHSQVIAAAPYIKMSAMISHASQMKGVEIKGILPESEKTVSDSANYIVPKSAVNLADNEIILGKSLANSLSLEVGQVVTLLLPKPGTRSIANIERKQFQFTGTIDLGGQLDANFAMISLPAAQKLKAFSNDQFDGIQVKIQEVLYARQLALEIGQQLDELVYIETWFRSQGNLYQDIQMVRMIVYITVFLIVAVASFNIVSTLIMEVNEKRASIAILKTMGAKDITIIKCFLLQGVIQALSGLLFGVVLGVLLSLSISDLYTLFSEFSGENVLAGTYFIDYLPSQLKLRDIGITVFVTVVMSLFACLYPAIKASKMDPAKILGH